MKKKLSLIITIIVYIFTAVPLSEHSKNTAKAADSIFASSDPGDICMKTLEKMYMSLPEPDVGTIGGDWSVLCLARGNYSGVNKNYFDSYQKRVSESVKKMSESSGRNNGELHRSKSTENSRVILALSSIGADPQNINGIDIVKPLENTDWVKKQGINGVIYALLAIDSKNYTYPAAQHEQLIEMILENQLPDKGWSIDNTSADPDITAAAIQALSAYTYRSEISEAVNEGLGCLSALYKKYWENENTRTSETLSQIMTACACTGTDPSASPDFIYGGISLYNELMSYYNEETYCFRHVKTGKDNSMATDQAMIALISYDRMQKKQNRIFDMNEKETLHSGYKISGLSVKLDNSITLKIHLIPGKQSEDDQDCTVKVYNLTDNSEYINADIHSVCEKSITNGKTNFIISVPVKYCQFSDNFEIILYSEKGSITNKICCSVREYAEKLIEKTENKDFINIAENLLHFGAAAQVFSHHNTKYPADKNIAEAKEKNFPFTAETSSSSTYGLPEWCHYKGSCLIIDNEIKIQHKFMSDTIPEGISRYSFDDSSGNYIFFTESSVSANSFFNTHTEECLNGKINFSIIGYLTKLTSDFDNSNMKSLCISLYYYEKSLYSYSNSL